MHINHEIEFKTLVSSDIFHQICKDYPDAHILDQTNVYYESESMNLKEKGFAIRIRDIHHQHLFTMKQKMSEGHKEYELYLDKNSPDAFNHPECLKLFEECKITGPFTSYGSLHTIRRSIQCKYGELCLDENEYCGFKDYEIEFEIDNDHPDEALKEFTEFLDTYQIEYQKAQPKRTRCQKRIKEIQK